MSSPITVTVGEASVIAGTTITVSQANIVAGGSVAVTVSNSPIASGAGKTVVSSGGIADLTSAQQDAIGEGTVVVTTDGYRYIYSGGGSKTNPASYVILADITPDWSTLTGKPSTFTPSSHASAHGSAGADPVTVAVSQVAGLQAALDGKQAAGSYASTIHAHAIADVTGLEAALDSKATPADVTAAVAAVVDAAPAALDTLNELAAALGDDENFASTVTSALAGKADVAHGHAGGDISIPDLAQGEFGTNTNLDQVFINIGVALSGKQPAGTYAQAAHTHAAADIVSGTIDIARIPTGVTAGTVCIGNDSRLTNARTPTAHKSSHATGGSDALTPADIGAANASHTHSAGDIASGTLNIARIPTGTTSSTVCIGNDGRLSDSRAPSGTAGGELSGTYPNPQIAAGAVVTAKIADLAVTDAKIAGMEASKLTGTVSDSRLSANAQQAIANSFHPFLLAGM